MSVRRLLAALGAMLLLAGCGGDPEPKVDPTPTSPTTSPTQSQTARPASAQDVIRQYVALSLEAQDSGETAAYRAAFAACKTCLKIADHIDKIYDEGGYIHAGAWEIRRITLAGNVGKRYEYNLAITAKPGEYKESGKVVKLSGGPNTFRMILHRSDGWVLTDLQDMT